MLNPTDMAQKVSRGDVSQQMTVRDFLAQMGVDVDGPVSQLAQALQKQSQMANPLNKIRMAGGRGAPAPMPPRGAAPVGRPPMVPPPGAPSGGGGGIADLIGKMGGR